MSGTWKRRFLLTGCRRWRGQGGRPSVLPTVGSAEERNDEPDGEGGRAGGESGMPNVHSRPTPLPPTLRGHFLEDA